MDGRWGRRICADAKLERVHRLSLHEHSAEHRHVSARSTFDHFIGPYQRDRIWIELQVRLGHDARRRAILKHQSPREPERGRAPALPGRLMRTRIRDMRDLAKVVTFLA